MAPAKPAVGVLSGILRGLLGRRLAVMIVLVSSLLTIVLTAVQLYFFYNRDVSQLERNLEQIQVVQMESLANSLWALDRDQAEIILKGLMRIQGVVSVRLMTNGEVFLEEHTPTEAETIHKSFPVKYKNRDDRVHLLGSLEIGASEAHARQRVLEQVGAILFSNGFKTLIVTLFMLLIFSRLLTRHLVAIGAFADAVAGGNLETPLVLNRPPTVEGREDELDALVNNLNTMRVAMAQSMTELREGEKRYRHLVESMNDGLGAIDRQGTITYANDQFCAMFGYRREELLGRRITEVLLSGENVERFKAQMALRGVHDEPYEMEYRHKQGHAVHALVAPRTIYDEAHTPIGSFAVVTDITERMKAERVMLQMNAELEARVEKRTEELQVAYQQLAVQQKMATIGQLTATVSHELRNPLGTIRNSLAALQARLKDPDEGLLRPLGRIERNVERCDNIIADLLDFSRHRQPVTLPTDLDAWLREVLNEQNIPEGIELSMELHGGGTVLEVDQDRLRRAVINVVENACQAMTAGADLDAAKRPLRLSVQSKVQEGRYRLTVSDNGCGISAEVLEKIFEPLYSTKTYGVGLGLPTVQQIMEQAGGEIEVHSVEGEGTQVVLWLPMPE